MPAAGRIPAAPNAAGLVTSQRYESLIRPADGALLGLPNVGRGQPGVKRPFSEVYVVSVNWAL